MCQFSDQSLWLSASKSNALAMSPAQYFRTNFHLKRRVARAVPRYSALGVVEPWVNGMRVNDDFLLLGGATPV